MPKLSNRSRKNRYYNFRKIRKYLQKISVVHEKTQEAKKT